MVQAMYDIEGLVESAAICFGHVGLLSSLISSVSLDHHLYAYDTQLFFSFHPLNFESSISHLQNALQQISSWMTANLLNSSKTKFLLIGLKNQLAKMHNTSLETSHSAGNLGSIFDEHLNSFSDQITSLFVNLILVPVTPLPTHLFLHPSLLPLLRFLFFLIFSYLCRALDYAGHLVSF